MKLQAISVLLVVMAIGCDGISSKQPGMVVVYAIDDDQESGGNEPSEQDMQRLIEVIYKRLNPDGRTEGSVRLLDDNRIEVSIFRADLEEMQRIADMLPRPGTLEFRILANRVDHADLIALAKATEDNMAYQPDDKKKDVKKLVARWVPVQNGREDEFALLKDIATRTRSKAGKSTLQILVVIDGYNVTGEYLEICSAGYDDRMRPCVNFLLTSKGGRRFGGLTTENCPDEIGDFKRHLGIILDGSLYSAPFINGPITTRGQISGDFSEEEVKDLAGLLRLGSLPTAIRKVEQGVVGMEEHN